MTIEDKTCPTCGKEFDTEHGVKTHHTTVHNKSLTKKSVDCAWCGNTIKIRRFRAESYDKNFCSNKNCRSEWLSETKTGKDHYRYNHKEFTCDYCGNKFETQPSNRVGKHTFCCRRCGADWSSEHLRGENHPQYKSGENEGFTPRERKQVFSRDNYTCQDCGDDSGGNLNAHHIVPSAESKEKRHDITNGITLCIDCHAQRHDEPIRSFVLAQKS